MKRILTLLIIIGIFAVSLMYHDEIVKFIADNFTDTIRKSSTISNNKYASNNNYKYVQLTDNFSPTNKDEIRNIYYTVINSGMSEFTFYCSKEYKDCLDDVNYISNNQKQLSYLNNFVPVYNSFKNIETEFDTLGKVKIKINYNYSDKEIEEINKKIDEIVKSVIKDNMDDEAKIKAIHDYIINNTKYDASKSDEKINKYRSDVAYGALIQGYAICGGYADSMKLFLDYFKIPNFKISSENHIWNAIYVNKTWLHLDATWDDPVTSTGEEVLDYTYFLITTEELLSTEAEQHGFDKTIYKELEEN